LLRQGKDFFNKRFNKSKKNRQSLANKQLYEPPVLDFKLCLSVPLYFIQSRAYTVFVPVNGLRHPKPKAGFLVQIVIQGQVIAESFIKKGWNGVTV
jgi:hypothetical protein